MILEANFAMPDLSLLFTMQQARKRKQAASISHVIYSIEILIVNTICIRKDGGHWDQGNIFVVFIDADYNKWLWN